MNRNFILLSLLILCFANTAEATTYYLKTNTYGNWEDACNWYTNPLDPNGSDCNGYPGIDDVAYMNSHSSVTLTQTTVVGTLIMSGFGSVNGNFQLIVKNNATLYSNNGINVANKVHIEGNLHFYGGSIGGTDTAFVHGLTYFHQNAGISKPLVMLGGGQWLAYHIGLSTSDGFLINPPGAVFTIHNTAAGVACNYDSGGEFKNYGTVIKDTPQNVTFNAPASMTGGEMHLLAGLTTFMNNFPCTNSELTVSDGAKLDFNNGARIFTNSSLHSAGYVKMKNTDVFNVGCSVSFDTLYCYGSGGPTFHIPITVPNLIMAGGAAWFYEPLTITGSFWWINGHFYGGATINCFPLAHLVEDGGSDSYTDCKFNFHGGAEWPSGNFEMNAGAEFNFPDGADFLITNNGGSISVNSNAPYGEINLTPGSILTKQGAASSTLDVVVNSNQSQILIQQGGLALWRGTHDDSYFQIAPSLVLNCYQNGNFFYRSEITGLGIFRESGFYSVIDSSTTLDCHLEMTGGDLHVRCPITPLSLKMTRGELRGTGLITVLGNCNWTGPAIITGTGLIDVQGFTTISGGGGRTFYKEIKMNGGGFWGGTFYLAFGTTGIIRVPAGATLTLSPTTTINNTGTQSATCGIIVDGGTVVKTTNFEFDFQGADFTNNGSVAGIGSFRTWNYAFVQPNTGNLSPGTFDTTGTLVWNGLFENKPSGNLVFDFENDGGQIRGDSLHFLHNLTLGGTLTVNADPCWPSFEKTILTWAGTKTGSFANVVLPTDYVLVVDDAAKKIKIVHTFLASAVTCPANVSVNTAPGSCSATPVLGLPTAANSNCSGSFSFSNDAPGTFPVGTTTVTWSATDPQGNTATCQQTVTVADVEQPTISCPMMLTINADAGQCTSSQFVPTASASDNCTLASLTNDAPAILAVGTYLVNYTATDASGNSALCAQGIVVQDVELPTITCPANISVDGCGTPNITIDPATATDNCGISSISNDAPASFPIGTTLVTHTATDVHGNTASCQQTINFTGADVENPLITTCPLDKTKLAEPGLCGASVNFSPAAATDNCGQPALYFSQNSGSFFGIGQTVVTLTATDGAGNSAVCAFTITVNPRQENTTNGLDDDCDGLVDEPMKLAFVRTNVSCHAAADGAIDLTVSQGLPPYSFVWSSGATSEDLTGLSGGEYTVTVEDAQGLMLEKTIVLAEPPAVKIGFDATNPLCFNTLTGTLTANPSRGVEPYFYQWNNGASSQTLTGLPSGTFSVVVTDANGCTASGAETLTEPAPLLISGMNVTANPCFGDAKGKASPIINPATNGTGQLTYLWSNGTASKLNANLPAGTYTVTVTDANGCSKTAAAALVDPAQLTLNHTISAPDANGKYTLTLAAAGGTPFPAPDQYRYCKLNPATGACGFSKTKIFANLLAGQAYNFRAKDSKGCQIEISVTMPAPRPANNRTDDASSESPTSQTFSLSPNPCRDFLRLRREADSEGEFRAQVFDANGRLIVDKIWANDLQQLDFQTTEWPSGVFWVRLQASDGAVSVRRAVKTD